MAYSYWIVGPGRLGLSLGSALAKESEGDLLVVGRAEVAPVHSLFERRSVTYSMGVPGTPPRGTCLLLTVPDSAVPEVAADIAELGEAPADCVMLHFDGSRPASILQPAAERGYAIGSLHPIQTIADPESGAERLAKARFTFEGGPTARVAAREIVDALGARMLEVHPRDKARYHAACVFASNYVVACAAVATRLLTEAADISGAEAEEALRPLWSSAAANLFRPGLPGALTGPIMRGDVETVRRHLGNLTGDTLKLYGQLALEALNVSRELGLEPQVAETIESDVRNAIAGVSKS